MAKFVAPKPDWLKAAQVRDISSVSGYISANFADYIHHRKHNGYRFFDSPELIRMVASDESASLDQTSLFYYEADEKEFDGQAWRGCAPEPPFPTRVIPPVRRQLEGFDVVTFCAGSSPECSPLSCNGLAAQIATNAHCLISSFDEAERSVAAREFNKSEPGPYRLFAVYSADWF